MNYFAGYHQHHLLGVEALLTEPLAALRVLADEGVVEVSVDAPAVEPQGSHTLRHGVVLAGEGLVLIDELIK